MAYYHSGFYDDEDIGAYHWTSHDVVPYENSVSFSHSEFPAANYSDAYEPYEARTEINYPTCDSISYDTGYVSCYSDAYESYTTRPPISYSNYEPVYCDTGHVSCYSDAYESYRTRPEIDYSNVGHDSCNSDAYESCGTRPEIKYSMYNVTEPKLIMYEPASCDTGYVSCYMDYESYRTRPEINYSAYSYTEPKLIGYEPVRCETGYVSYGMQYTISYSKAGPGSNDLDFEEYDPTPYDGGYDSSVTYGKPLPPSDEICYPLSTPIEPSDMPHESFSEMGVAKSDGGGSEIKKPDSLNIKKESGIIEPEPAPEPEPKPNTEPEEILDSSQGKEIVEYGYPDYGYDDYPWPEYDYWIGNGRRGGGYYDYGCERQVVQAPREYNSDVVDLCESLFGHWPCLARAREQREIRRSGNINQGVDDEGIRNNNPWKGTADYIFGGSIY